MGFFDKLREVANKAVDSVQNLNNPLPNETAKVYYEIVYGALKSLGVGANYKALKKYVEFHTGQKCDEAILQQVLIWFADDYGQRKYYLTSSEDGMRARANITKPKGITPGTTEKIIELNKELDLAPKYRCSFEEACDICYKDEVAEIRAAYQKVFDIIAERKKYRYLEPGLKKIEKDSRTEYGLLAKRLLRKWIFEDLDAGKAIVLKAYAEAVVYSIKCIRENRECITGGPMCYVSAIAIRALHFDQYGGNKKDYSSISNGECKEFIMKHSSFMSLRDDAYTRNRDWMIGSIESAKIPTEYNRYTGDDFWTPQVGSEDYYVDMICYHAWKTLCEEFPEVVNDDDMPVSKSKQPDDVTSLLYHGSIEHYGELKTYANTEEKATIEEEV